MSDDPEVRYVSANGLRFAVREWGHGVAGPLVLLPGNGLAAALFAPSERLLSDEWHGYSIDRRGQGLSEQPGDGYEFADFADDLIAIGDALQLERALAIGHSGGGTDLLIAASRAPRHWSRIAVIEPTVQDPRRPPQPETDPPSWMEPFERSQRRRGDFPSLDEAVERFRTNPSFERCAPELVREYLAGALARQEDGTMSLRCPPRIEALINRGVMQVMQHRYNAESGDPFSLLPGLDLPVLVTTTGQSGDIYRTMSRIALDVIPGSEHRHYPDLGHLLPLESPGTMVELADWLRTGE